MREKLIGRKRVLDELKKKIFLCRSDISSESPKTCSLTGPMGVGKRRVLEEAVEQFERDGHPNVFLFRQDLSQCEATSVLLKDYAQDFQSALTSEVLSKAPVPDAELMKAVQNSLAWFSEQQDKIEENPRFPMVVNYTKKHFKSLLRACSEMGFHIILILSSFDSLLDPDHLEENQSVANFLFSLSAKDLDCIPNLNILLISERMPRFIVKRDGSNFESAYKPIVLRDFDDDDMEEYFQSYEALPCGVPDEKLRKEILACAGRLPSTLMDLRQKIAETGVRNQDAISVRTLLPDWSALYRHHCSLLRTQWVDSYRYDADNHIFAMDVFRSYFLQKDRSPETVGRMEQLYTFGLVDSCTANQYTPLTECPSGDGGFLTYVRNSELSPCPELKMRTQRNTTGGETANVKCAWLQMSDLHVKDLARTRQIYDHYEALAKYLNPRPEFLVLTGDFRHQRWKTKFDQAGKFLCRVLSIFQIAPENVFLVPGNHDVGTIPPHRRMNERRSKIIQNICEHVDDEEEYRGSISEILDCFHEYDDFARAFFKDTGVTDDRMVNPSKVFCITWKNMLNLLCVNTALISDGRRDHKEILDINALFSINLPTEYPTIMLGHHGLDALTPKQSEMVRTFITNRGVSAYLHGDIHLHNENPIYPVSLAGAAEPALCVACGKSAPQANDLSSDVGVVHYTWREDGKVYLHRFSWDFHSGFYPDKRFEGLYGPRSFSMRTR